MTVTQLKEELSWQSLLILFSGVSCWQPLE